VILLALFLDLPRYTPPGPLGITRPVLIFLPPLWIAIGLSYWRRREESEIARAVALTAVILVVAHTAMLYSMAPNDAVAMVAHLGKFVGDAFFLFSLTQIGAADTVRRIEVQHRLAVLNHELDMRVQQQTTQLRATNEKLLFEMEARHKSHSLLEAVTENTQAVLYAKNLEGRYLIVNRRYCEIFRKKRDEIIGRTDHDLFTTAEADAFRAMDERVLGAGHALTEEESAPHADGLHTYISVKAPLKDERGQTYGVFGISTDITDLKRAEQALAESEERARLIIETALDAVINIDSSGIILNWSPQAEKTFGWSREEAIGRRLSQTILPHRYRAQHEAGLARYVATGEARVLNERIEIFALHRNGHEFPVELSITAIRSGGVISFSGFVRDITERKVTQERLEMQLERLRLLHQITRAIGQRHDIQSIFQVVVRSLEDQLPADFVSICLYDRIKHVLIVRHVGAKSAGLGRALGMFEQADIPVDENGLSQCVRGALVCEPDITETEYPFPRRLAQKGLRSLVITPLIVEEDVFGVLIAARLVQNAFSSADCEFLKQLGEHAALAAHQAQLRASLETAYDDLKQTQQAVMQQERLKALGQMASGIAHDINNAISPVAVYTKSLLEREPNLSSRTRDYLGIVDRVVKDISVTVARMRDFYRRSDAESDLQPLNLNALVPEVVELTRARWSDMPLQRGIVINVVTQLEQNLPAVMGNAADLREATTNLIFNAVDAMPEGGTITIRTAAVLRAPDTGARVLFEVGDTGIGMDEMTRRRCLEPFFTTKGERGTGLGLAMVYGAAQRHKAALAIDSVPGNGTHVRLEFAAATEAEKPVAATVDVAQIPQLRVLLVDDDPGVLESTQIVLELDGHAILAADGGRAGIDALRSAKLAGETFDVMITDLGMPYVDGNQVARAAKELHPAMTVILLTGWGGRIGARDQQAENVDYTLAKPLDLDELRKIFLRLPPRRH
jgi:PAS domain S-box-containing protein